MNNKDRYEVLPGSTFTFYLEQAAKALKLKRTLALLPMGINAAAAEGKMLEVTAWDAETKALMGESPAAEILITAWGQENPGVSLRVLPIHEGATTAASLKISLHSVSTDPDPTITTAGKIVFAVNGSRFALGFTDGETFTDAAANLAALMSTVPGITALVDSSDPKNPYSVAVSTNMKGSIANQTIFRWLIADPEYLLPGNLKPMDLELKFSGGTQSADLAEKLVLYDKYIEDTNMAFFSPYNELEDMEALYKGFSAVFDRFLDGLPFIPLMHIIVRRFKNEADSIEYRKLLNRYNAFLVPVYDYFGDILEVQGRFTGVLMLYADKKRLVNGTRIPMPKIFEPSPLIKEKQSELIQNGLSILTTDTLGNVMILRAVCAYKDKEANKPIDALTQLIGAIYIVNGVGEYADAVEKAKYLIVDSNVGEGRTTAQIQQINLTKFIQSVYVDDINDNVLESIGAQDITCAKKDAETLVYGIVFKVINSLNRMHFNFKQTIE